MPDYYQVTELFTVEERQVQVTVCEFLEVESLPHRRDWWEQDVFPAELVPRFSELGLMTDPGAMSTQDRRHSDFQTARESAEKWQM